MKLTPAQERDSLQKLSITDLKHRISLAECVIMDAIKESAGATAIREVIRQRDQIVKVLKDKRAKKRKPGGVVIQLQPLNILARRQAMGGK